jgi:hypothetical protein
MLTCNARLVLRHALRCGYRAAAIDSDLNQALTNCIPRKAHIQQITLNSRMLLALHLTVLRPYPGSRSGKRIDLNQTKLAFASAVENANCSSLCSLRTDDNFLLRCGSDPLRSNSH